MSYRISEAARLTGLSAKAIRFYEEIGLIPAASRSNPSYHSPGYRAYSDADLRRLSLIKRGKLLNLSIEQLKQLVEAADEGCCQTLEPKFHSLLEAKLQETEVKLRELAELRTTLQTALRANGRSAKETTAASDCFTDDCGFTVPVEQITRKAAHAAKVSEKAAGPSSRTKRGLQRIALPLVQSGSCYEPDCSPDACP